MANNSTSLDARKAGRMSVWLFACGIFVAVFLVFVVSLTFDFITYDDPEFVVDNPRVNSGLGLENLKWAFASPGEVNLWNPLTSLSHQLDVTLFGLNPMWHHAVNVFWHALAAMLLFLACRKLTVPLGWSCFIALLWAVHPQRIQSVAWISERKGVLSGALFFASILFFAEWMIRKHRGIAFYLLSLFLFTAAALAKPSAVPLPLVLFVLFFARRERFASSFAESWRPLLPFFGVAGVISVIVVLFQSQGTLSEVGAADSLLERFRQVVMSYTFYLNRFIFPVPSRLLVTPPSSQTPFVISLIVVVLFVAAVIKFGRSNRFILAGAMIYTVLWLPISGIVPVSHYFVADRYSYLSQVGIIVMFVGVAQLVSVRIGTRIPAISCAVLVVVNFVFLQVQLPIWKNSETLFGHEMKVNPTSGMAPIHYGEFFREEDPAKALRYYELAHKNASDEGIPLTKMGMMQVELGQKEEALQSFLKAIRVSKPVSESWTQLLLLQVDLKQYDDAEATVIDGVEKFPGQWPILMNGGNFYLLVKRTPEKALPLFLKAHEVRPRDFDSIRACLRCYRLLGDEKSAGRFERLLLTR